eukprot:7543212-Alexandrium_andersonii.AAC.1
MESGFGATNGASCTGLGRVMSRGQFTGPSTVLLTTAPSSGAVLFGPPLMGAGVSGQGILAGGVTPPGRS